MKWAVPFARRQHLESDFRASARGAQEELDQIESGLRSALEFEIDHRVVLRLMASVAYARGADEEVLDFMRQCFDLHMSMSRGRLATCQYCGQLRGDNVEMLTCGSCRVSCYCCAEHQRLAWNDSVRAFSGHKHLCPLLKERLISKGQGSQDALNPAVLQCINHISGFKKEDKDEEGWATEKGEDEEEEEQAADDAQARPESGAATVAQEPQQREQQQLADQTQTEKQSSQQEAAERPKREELEKKSIKELREMCKSKGLDYSSWSTRTTWSISSPATPTSRRPQRPRRLPRPQEWGRLLPLLLLQALVQLMNMATWSQ